MTGSTAVANISKPRGLSNRGRTSRPYMYGRILWIGGGVFLDPNSIRETRLGMTPPRAARRELVSTISFTITARVRVVVA